MSEPLLHRTAFALGSFARRSVQVLAYPVRAASKLIARWWLRRDYEPAAKRLPVYRHSSAEPRPLVPSYLSPDVEERCRAAAVAGELDSAGSNPLLIELLHDTAPEVRCAAAEAAGRARAASTVFSLILALDDPAPTVRAAAERALRRLTGKPLKLPETGIERQQQIEELKRWWKEQRLLDLTGNLGRGPA